MLRAACGLVLVAACAAHVPRKEPRAPAAPPEDAATDEPGLPIVPFGVLPEITDFDVYPSDENKDKDRDVDAAIWLTLRVLVVLRRIN